MKRISKVLVFLLMTVTFSLLCMPAEAALSGDYYSDSDAKEFYDSISFREIEPTENMGKIVSFDVANQILLAFSSQKIAVCDTSGKILKAFEFQTYGNYYVQWCGDDIQIYFVRGDSLLTVMQDGELVSCIAVTDAFLSVSITACGTEAAETDRMPESKTSAAESTAPNFVSRFVFIALSFQNFSF